MNATRRLSIAALVVACTHLVFGAIVRISGSGMGCGDNWPKCYGYWFPPFSRPDLVVEVLHHDVGLEVPFGGRLVDEMVAALGRHDPGAPVLPYLMSGGTDNKALDKLGITGYGFAPLQLTPELDFPAMFHGVDERVPLSALSFGRAVLGDFLRHC